MSHIFDALQRSEDERAGADSRALSGATELLWRAERRTASKWESPVVPHQADAAESAERDPSLGLQTLDPDSTGGATPAANSHTLADRHLDIFDQFQRLQVALTPQNRLVCLNDAESLAAEAFRLLGVRLQNLRRGRPLKKLLVTSTIPQEGKSTIVANLACTLAQRTQQKVLLLEGDLRRPSISQNFGLGSNPGLCEYLEGERALTKCIYHLEGPSLWMLPAGSTKINALELLQSGKLSALLDQLAAWFEWIIIDSPPLLPMADTSVWARLADGILLVTRQGTTQKRHLERGLEAIEPNKLIGALVNCSLGSSHNDYYYGAYYGATNVSRRSDESIR